MTAKIIDSNGRIGDIIDDRGHCLFARPEGQSQLVGDHRGVTGVAGAKLMTATAWTKKPDGSYVGLWFDSPSDAFVTARIVD